MTDNNENKAETPVDAAQQDVAQSSDAKAEAAGTAAASDELSEDDLEAVAGGFGYARHRTGSGS